MNSTKSNLLFWIGIITATWFALTGIAWAYYACLVIAYPFGLTSFLIWRSIKRDGKSRNKFIPIILIIGLVFSISVLLYLMLVD
jgi:hypothetical protein